MLSVRLYEVITLWLLAEKSTSEIKLLIGWFGLETEIATKHNQLDCCSTYYCVLYGLVWTMSHSTTCLVSLLHNIHELNWWMVIAILATFWTCGFKTFDFFLFGVRYLSLAVTCFVILIFVSCGFTTLIIYSVIF